MYGKFSINAINISVDVDDVSVGNPIEFQQNIQSINKMDPCDSSVGSLMASKLDGSTHAMIMNSTSLLNSFKNFNSMDNVNGKPCGNIQELNGNTDSELVGSNNSNNWISKEANFECKYVLGAMQKSQTCQTDDKNQLCMKIKTEETNMNDICDETKTFYPTGNCDSFGKKEQFDGEMKSYVQSRLNRDESKHVANVTR